MVIKPGDRIKIFEWVPVEGKTYNEKRFLEKGIFQAYSVTGEEGDSYPTVIYLDEKLFLSSAFVELVSMI